MLMRELCYITAITVANPLVTRAIEDRLEGGGGGFSIFGLMGAFSVGCTAGLVTAPFQVHTHTHTHTHTQVQPHTHPHRHTQKYTRTHTHTHNCTYTHAHTQTQSHTYTNTYAHTHAHTLTHARTHTHARTSGKEPRKWFFPKRKRSFPKETARFQKR